MNKLNFKNWLSDKEIDAELFYINCRKAHNNLGKRRKKLGKRNPEEWLTNAFCWETNKICQNLMFWHSLNQDWLTALKESKGEIEFGFDENPEEFLRHETWDGKPTLCWVSSTKEGAKAKKIKGLVVACNNSERTFFAVEGEKRNCRGGASWNYALPCGF